MSWLRLMALKRAITLTQLPAAGRAKPMWTA